MELNRGDIVIVNLYPKKGDEVGKIRPVVIIFPRSQAPAWECI